MQGLLRKPRIPASPLFVFDTQPLAKPPARMLLHGSLNRKINGWANYIDHPPSYRLEKLGMRNTIEVGAIQFPGGPFIPLWTSAFHGAL